MKSLSTIGISAAMLMAVAVSGEVWHFDGPDALKEHPEGGVLQGTGTWREAGGVTGGGWYFNGESDFLTWEPSEATRPGHQFTVSFWVRPEADSEVWQLFRHPQGNFSFDGGPGFGWFQAYTADNSQLYNGYAHPQQLQPGQWYHFALVYDCTGLEMWLDGDLIGSARTENDPGELRETPGVPYAIGGRLRGAKAGFFHGMLDNLEISNRARHEFPEVKKLKLIQRLRAVAPDRTELQNLSSDTDVASVARDILDDVRRRLMSENFGEASAALPFAVAVEPALTRILADDFRVGTIVNAVQIETAARERENAQLLILPYDGKDLDVQIAVPAELVDENGVSQPFAIKTYQVNYAPLPKPSPYMYELSAIPEQLYAAERFVVPAEKLAPVWLEVFTPAGTPAGVYRGSVDVNGFSLPLTVTVWDFELPLRNEVPTLVNIWERDIQTYLNEGDVEGFVDRYVAFGEMMLEHRLNPVVLSHTGLVAPWIRKEVYPDYRVENGEVIANTVYLDKIIEHFRSLGMSRVALGPHYNFDETALNGGDWTANIRATQPEKVWRFVQEHAEKQGWLDDAVAYAIDEPEDNYPLVNSVSQVLGKVAPDLPLVLTSGGANYPNAAFDNIGVWVPILHWTNRREMERKQAAGVPVWTYVCTGPNYPNPNWHSDTPGMGVRGMLIGAARYGYDGFLHWAVNFNTFKGANPEDANAYAAGEGTYIYSDENGYPVPTVRLKYIGDGMEDWLYLHLLREYDSAAYESIMAELAALIPEPDWDRNREITLKEPREASFHTFLDGQAFYEVYNRPERWLELRRKIARHLSGMPRRNNNNR